MSSTNEPRVGRGHIPAWRVAGLRYFSYNFFLQKKFGHRVQRVSVDAGLTCPNVDGTVARGGCVFCDNRSFSPSRRLPRLDIGAQIEEGIHRLAKRYPKCRRYIAYFQPATNTYAPADRLRPLYEQALAHPQIVGLSIGTRPDCVPDDVLDLLEDLAEHTYVSVEYGMQTVHNRSLDWMNRGHHHDSTVRAVERSRERGLEIGAHVILGLPGESRGEMLETARELARLDIDAVKIHNLYAVENTPLADDVRAGRVSLLDRDAYVQAVVDMLEVLTPRTIVQRLGGDAPAKYFVAPSWCLDKAGVKRAIHDELERRDTWQGRAFQRVG